MIVVTGPPRSGKNFILDIYKNCGVRTAVINDDNTLEEVMKSKPSVVKCAKFKKVTNSINSSDIVYIMIRNINDVLNESIRIGISKSKRDLTRKIYCRIGHIVYWCEENKIEYDILHYPDILHDFTYAQNMLDPESDGIHYHEFEQAWELARYKRVKK